MTLAISNQQTLIDFIKDNLIGDSNLSIRGLAGLCDVSDKSIINGGSFNAYKLGQMLIAQGFDAGSLVKEGFDAKATWLVIEYFAYESKAKAIGAKQLARTFGQIGVMNTFERLSQKEQPTLPKTFAEALQLAADQAKAIELMEAEKALLEQENLQLSEAVDDLFEYSSIIRIAKFNNCSESNFNWRTLKAASIQMKIEIKKVPCPRFQTKNLYSHDVWRLVYPTAKLPETTTLVIKH